MTKLAFFAALLLIAGAGLPADARATSELQPTEGSESSNITLKESVPWPSWYSALFMMRTYV
ncbi:hypothetical protein GN244_ATG19275 [Phytophthora infestans]|uniref:Secreted RxLR effector peptide protein n=1 Tax=Phytophthora infestans TaxID=4787 RepID=A0A833SLY7_PHYIN|nr:hypothetical protein GN244_ATG19275 [Phytophthora infestans]KAF4128083.1 hypothetical protein GN958_ATG22736 [Phytophthora infestans]